MFKSTHERFGETCRSVQTVRQCNKRSSDLHAPQARVGKYTNCPSHLLANSYDQLADIATTEVETGKLLSDPK